MQFLHDIESTNGELGNDVTKFFGPTSFLYIIYVGKRRYTFLYAINQQTKSIREVYLRCVQNFIHYKKVSVKFFGYSVFSNFTIPKTLLFALGTLKNIFLLIF